MTSLPYYNSADFTPHWIDNNDKKLSDFHRVIDFELTDQDGNVFDQSHLDGNIYVSSFFFTTCSGICRQLTLNMKTVSEAFIDNNQIHFVMHTVTPEMDHPEQLKKYLERYEIDSKQWHLLTGQKSEIYNLARTAYFSDETFNNTNKASDFIHTEKFLLIDKNKRIRGVYNGTLKLEVKKMIEHIKILLKED